MRLLKPHSFFIIIAIISDVQVTSDLISLDQKIEYLVPCDNCELYEIILWKIKSEFN